MQHTHSDAIEQVFTEAPVSNFLHQVAVSGGDQPHIDLEFLAGTYRGEGAFLQYAQEAYLHIRR